MKAWIDNRKGVGYEGDNDRRVAGKAGRGNMPQVQGMQHTTPAHLRRNKENY